MSKKRKYQHNIYPFEVGAMSVEGRGIAELEGRKVFIFGALEHEKVQAKVVRQHARYLEATVESITESSERRVSPPCPYFGTCGGCQLQHLSIEDQLLHKENQLKKMLEHLGIQPQAWMSPLTGPAHGYRYKARLGVRYVEKKEKLLIGFREAHSNKLVDMDSCYILHPKLGQHIEVLKALIGSLDAYQAIPQIEFAAGDEDAVLIFRVLEALTAQDEAKLIEFSKTYGFSVYLQPKGPDSIYKIGPNNDVQTLSYRNPLFDLTYHFNPLDFTQVNPHINARMVAQAIDWLSLSQNDSVLDLFCGLGNFSLALAKHAGHVIGVEGDAEMVKRAYHNALINNIKHVNFHAANLFEDCKNLSWFNMSYDKLVLDPPRSGAKWIAEHIYLLAPKVILYVSCDMNTFARDAAILTNQRYALKQVGIMDMFPHTKHAETMGLFVFQE